MSTEQIVLYLVSAAGSILAVFKLLLPRIVDAKLKSQEAELKAREYDRARRTFYDDASLDMLRDTLEHWKFSHTEERKEALESKKQQTDLIVQIGRLANKVSQQTDMMRILVQQVTVVTDRIREIEEKLPDGRSID